MNTRIKVIEWAIEKKLFNPMKQALKMVAEVGELCDELCKSNIDNPLRDKTERIEKIIDEIGDIEITLTILKSQLGIPQNEPLDKSYEKISQRKGETINGTFIKD